MTSSFRAFHLAKTTLIRDHETIKLEEATLDLGTVQIQISQDPPLLGCVALNKLVLMRALRNCRSNPFNYEIYTPRNLPRINRRDGPLTICSVSSYVDKIIGDWCKLKKYFNAPGYHLCSWFWLQPSFPLFNHILPSDELATNTVFQNTHVRLICTCDEPESCGMEDSDGPVSFTLTIPHTTERIATSSDCSSSNFPMVKYAKLKLRPSANGYMTFSYNNYFPFVFVEFLHPTEFKQILNNVNPEAINFQLEMNGTVLPNRWAATKSPYVWLFLLDDCVQNKEDCAVEVRDFVNHPTRYFGAGDASFCSVKVSSDLSLDVTLIELTGFHTSLAVSERPFMSLVDFPGPCETDQIDDLYSMLPISQRPRKILPRVAHVPMNLDFENMLQGEAVFEVAEPPHIGNLQQRLIPNHEWKVWNGPPL